jgi:hypothetical protein
MMRSMLNNICEYFYTRVYLSKKIKGTRRDKIRIRKEDQTFCCWNWFNFHTERRNTKRDRKVVAMISVLRRRPNANKALSFFLFLVPGDKVFWKNA